MTLRLPMAIGPSGPKGDAGPQGAKGERGPSGAGSLPTGAILPFAGAAAPTGFLLCQGARVVIKDYPELYAVIGDTYGLSPAGYFAVPDLSGRFPLGAGAGVGLTARSLGAQGGEETHILTLAEMPKHHHTLGRDNNGTWGDCPDSLACNQGISHYGGEIPVSSAGSDKPHNIMPPFLGLNFIIKA